MLFRRYLREIQYGGHETGHRIEFLIDYDATARQSILHCDGDPTFGNMVEAFEINFYQIPICGRS